MSTSPATFDALQLENSVIEWTEQVYSEAEQELSGSHELKLTGKLIDYIHGRQWSPQARFGRSRPVNNRLFRQFIEMVGLLTDIEPDFQVKFFDTRDGFSELEKLLNEMITMWANMSDFEMELSQTVMYGLIHTGYAKIQWNPALNHGLGDNQFVPISPINLMVVGSQARMQDAECIINRQPVTLAYLKRKFGRVADGVRVDAGISGAPAQMMRPAKMTPTQWSSLPPQLKRMLGQKEEGHSTKYPVALMKEFWMRDDSVWEGSESIRIGPELANWSYIVEPGMKLYPRGRVIVTAGRKVLEDTCNPYWHGNFPFAEFRPIRVPWQREGLCYDDQTEVLTRRGWLKFSETNEHDEFATRQIGTGKFEWQKSIARTEEPYSGDMYHFHSRSVDIMVTPEHRMLVAGLPRPLGGSTARKGEAVVSAKLLAQYGNHHTMIPQTSVWEGVELGIQHFNCDLEEKIASMLAKSKRIGRAGMTEKSVRAIAPLTSKPVDMSGDDYCAFMGAFLSEGWTAPRKVHISQHVESKGYKPFKELLERIFGGNIYHDGKDFIVHRKQLRDYCRQFGKSYEKYVPEEIMNATPRQLKIFWDFYMLGDGHYAKRSSKTGRGNHERFAQRITTASKKMAGQLMEIAQKMGFSASILTRPARKDVPLFEPGRICQVRESYVVSLRGSKAMSAKATKTTYTGTIHCVTVPNSFLYVRRNGRPTWCGNSALEPLAAIQNILNRINGGVMDTINAAIEPSIIAPKAAFSQQSWDSMDPGAPGGKFQYNNNSPKAPEFRKPPELGSYVLPFAQELMKEQDATSGSAAINQALGKKQVPGGDSLDMIMNSRSTNIRLMGRSLKSFLTDVGQMSVCNFLQFSTAKARAAVYGGRGLLDSDFTPMYGQLLPQGMEPEAFVRMVNFSIRKGSLLSIEKAEEIQIAFGLRKMKDLSRSGLYRKLDANIDVKQIEAELLEEAIINIKLAGAASQSSGKSGHGHK